MPIDYSVLALPKHTPRVLVKAAKDRKNRSAWRKTAKAVDKRDEAEDLEGRPVCFITGKYLLKVSSDEWRQRDRCHIESRSQSKARKNDVNNVLSCSRGVHRLIDASALLLLNKRGREAKSVKAIDHVAWNRRMVAKGDEPIRIRKGLAVRELPA
jgi:hypothetical protein